MFDIDALKGYRPLVLSTRVQTAAVCLAVCFVALPAASPASISFDDVMAGGITRRARKPFWRQDAGVD